MLAVELVYKILKELKSLRLSNTESVDPILVESLLTRKSKIDVNALKDLLDGRGCLLSLPDLVDVFPLSDLPLGKEHEFYLRMWILDHAELESLEKIWAVKGYSPAELELWLELNENGGLIYLRYVGHTERTAELRVEEDKKRTCGFMRRFLDASRETKDDIQEPVVSYFNLEGDFDFETIELYLTLIFNLPRLFTKCWGIPSSYTAIR